MVNRKNIGLLFLLTICVFIRNTISLSLDTLHSTRNSEDEDFKQALESIQRRRSLAEKRSSFHYGNRFTKKDDEDELAEKNYHSSVNTLYSPALSRNIQRFLSEIDDEESGELSQKQQDRNKKKYEIIHEEELKPDVVSFDGKRKKAHNREFNSDMEGPSRIFAHKSSPIFEKMDENEGSSNNHELQENNKPLFMSTKRKKKNKSNLFKYTQGMEHYSRFWDPKKSRERFQMKKKYHARYGDSFNKRRFNKRRSYQEEPLIVQTNVKGSKGNKEQVLGELNEILKDEEEDKKEIKKRENLKDDGENVVETKLDNSNDSHTNKELIDSEKGGKISREDGDKFNQWLKDEYFKTMAMTMATMKKKRSGWSPIVSADSEDISTPMQHFTYDEDPEDENSRKFEAIEDKLKTIESAMLSDALQLIREGTEGREESEQFGREILDKLYAANDVQKLRENLNHLRGTMDKIKRYDDDEEEEEDDDDDHNADSEMDISTWPKMLPKKREEDLAKALRVMAPYQSKRQYSIPNGIEPYLPRISMRSLPSSTEEVSSDQLIPIYSASGTFPRQLDNDEVTDTDDTDVNNCPALDLLASDCSVLGNIVPAEPLKRLVLEACNWHEVCYTCGGSFGLSADECDVGFVEESSSICQDDIPCQTTARMMLLPLRQRRVFFKRSVPAICYRDPCVERFLRNG